MKIAKLIKNLKKFDSNLEVGIEGCESICDIQSISLENDTYKKKFVLLSGKNLEMGF